MALFQQARVALAAGVREALAALGAVLGASFIGFGTLALLNLAGPG